MRSVVCITFNKDNTLHMIVDNLEFAKQYCKVHPDFDWEQWTVQKLDPKNISTKLTDSEGKK